MTISPTNAGTKRKPTAAKLSFKVINSAASKTTLARIRFVLPAGVKLDGNRLKRCTLATLEHRGPRGCSSASKLGTGVAYAFIVTPGPAPDCVGTNGAAGGCLTFDTAFFVGARRQLNVFLQQRGGGVAKMFAGKISANGRSLTIDIPKDLQSPMTNLYTALMQLSGSFSRTARSSGRTHSFVSTSGCRNGGWSVATTLTYAANNFPVPSPATRTADSHIRCKK